jgi:hypothetical protein
VAGVHDGNPVVIGNVGAEDVFVGLETPLSKSSIAEDRFKSFVPSKTPLALGQKYVQTTSVGVSQTGQLRRSFNFYLERERAYPRRTFLHYQSWYDNRSSQDLLDSTKLNISMRILGDELYARKVRLDGFFIDSGWDYKRTPKAQNESKLNVWSFDPIQFPNGFAPQKEITKTYNAEMAVWMSPFGGYDQALALRLALNNSKPVNERFKLSSNGRFTLSDPKYYLHFKSTALDMIRNQAVKAFKFDGVGVILPENNWLQK